MHEKYVPQDLELIGIALSSRAALEKKVEQLDITWPQVDSRSAGDLPMRYSVRGVSTFVLIDSQGKILARGMKLSQMEALIESVVNASSPLKRRVGYNEAPRSPADFRRSRALAR